MLTSVGIGYRDVLDLPWTRAVALARAAERAERRRLAAMAVAMRAAQADRRAFIAWMRDFDGPSA